MFAALIHPDGRLTTLSGELTTDAASIAALAHAVYAAGNELALRLKTATPAQKISLTGPAQNLSLFPTAQGVLLIEHDPVETEAAVQMRAAALLAQFQAPPPPPPVAAAPMSLADALYATAP